MVPIRPAFRLAFVFLAGFPFAPAGAAEAEQALERRVHAILDAERSPPPASGTEAPPPSLPPAPCPVFQLRDGGRVVGTPKFEALEVETRYGVLRIPRAELEQVRFAQGEAPAGNRGSRSDLVPPLPGLQDECRTAKMVVRGRVRTERFHLDTPYGELVVTRGDLEAITFRSDGQVTTRLQVAPRFQPPARWLDTRIELRLGDRLRLRTSGSITVESFGLRSGPAGTTEYTGPSTYGGFPMLALVAKVGKSGKAFLVGRGGSQAVRTAGRLYLSIVPFVFSPMEPIGSYEVTVEVARQP